MRTIQMRLVATVRMGNLLGVDIISSNHLGINSQHGAGTKTL